MQRKLVHYFKVLNQRTQKSPLVISKMILDEVDAIEPLQVGSGS
jgi:hypothetical protein